MGDVFHQPGHNPDGSTPNRVIPHSDFQLSIGQSQLLRLSRANIHNLIKQVEALIDGPIPIQHTPYRPQQCHFAHMQLTDTEACRPSDSDYSLLIQILQYAECACPEISAEVRWLKCAHPSQKHWHVALHILGYVKKFSQLQFRDGTNWMVPAGSIVFPLEIDGRVEYSDGRGGKLFFIPQALMDLMHPDETSRKAVVSLRRHLWPARAITRSPYNPDSDKAGALAWFKCLRSLSKHYYVDAVLWDCFQRFAKACYEKHPGLFVAAPEFLGARPFYTYKTGPDGTGYYLNWPAYMRSVFRGGGGDVDEAFRANAQVICHFIGIAPRAGAELAWHCVMTTASTIQPWYLPIVPAPPQQASAAGESSSLTLRAYTDFSGFKYTEFTVTLGTKQDDTPVELLTAFTHDLAEPVLKKIAAYVGEIQIYTDPNDHPVLAGLPPSLLGGRLITVNSDLKALANDNDPAYIDSARASKRRSSTTTKQKILVVVPNDMYLVTGWQIVYGESSATRLVIPHERQSESGMCLQSLFEHKAPVYDAKDGSLNSMRELQQWVKQKYEQPAAPTADARHDQDMESQRRLVLGSAAGLGLACLSHREGHPLDAQFGTIDEPTFQLFFRNTGRTIDGTDISFEPGGLQVCCRTPLRSANFIGDGHTVLRQVQTSIQPTDGIALLGEEEVTSALGFGHNVFYAQQDGWISDEEADIFHVKKLRAVGQPFGSPPPIESVITYVEDAHGGEAVLHTKAQALQLLAQAHDLFSPSRYAAWGYSNNVEEHVSQVHGSGRAVWFADRETSSGRLEFFLGE